MRKLTLLLLLATAAAPALAQDRDRSGRHQRNDSAEQSDNESQRESRRSETRSSRERSGGDQPGAFERVREHREQRVETTATVSAGPSGDGHVTVRRDGEDNDGPGRRFRRVDDGATGATTTTTTTTSTAGQPTDWRARERRVRTIPDTQPSVRRPVQVDREGVQHRRGRDYRDGDYRRWTGDWHRDRRYDWRRYRNHNRSLFRLGFYYDPFGWNYRRWSIGSYLYPSFYGSRYWLDDPWRYRLPPAYGPYRWVRYWNDALLVNIYTGEVVEVMHGFFW
jgi:Ni/Co efflux regulator RcnB